MTLTITGRRLLRLTLATALMTVALASLTRIVANEEAGRAFAFFAVIGVLATLGFGWAFVSALKEEHARRRRPRGAR